MKWFRVFFFAVIFAQSAQILYLAWSQSWTYDEPNHLSWSTGILKNREMPREGSFISTTPVTLLNAIPYYYLPKWGVTNHQVVLFAARAVTILWWWLLLILSFQISQVLFDRTTAFLTTLLIALDPSLVAHSSLITVDVAFAAQTLLTIFLLLRYYRAPNLVTSSLLGIGLGLAFSTKYTSVLLAVGISLVLLARMFQAGTPRRIRTLITHSLSVFIATVVTINFCYLFHRTLVPYSQIDFQSAFFLSLQKHLGRFPLIVPEAFLLGLDRVFHTERNQLWNVVILGQFLTRGVWYYFPICFLIKTPLASLVVQGLGVARFFRREFWTPLRAILFTQFGIFLIYFCFIFKTQVGYRYVFMCIPLALILCLGALQPLFQKAQLKTAVILTFVFIFAEWAPFFGDALPFSNSVVFPKTSIYQWVADSNVDWGQSFGKAWKELNQNHLTDRINPPHLLPGSNIFTVNYLAGVFHNHSQYRWVRENLKPTRHYQHTYLQFEVSPEDFEKFLEAERRVEPRGLAQNSPCANQKPVNVSQLSQTSQLSAGNFQCLNLETEAVIKVTAKKGSASVGFAWTGNCLGEKVEADQSLFFKMAPGVYPVCYQDTKEFSPEWQVYLGRISR